MIVVHNGSLPGRPRCAHFVETLYDSCAQRLTAGQATLRTCMLLYGKALVCKWSVSVHEQILPFCSEHRATYVARRAHPSQTAILQCEHTCDIGRYASWVCMLITM
jgi:hypothetical protein